MGFLFWAERSPAAEVILVWNFSFKSQQNLLSLSFSLLFLTISTLKSGIQCKSEGFALEMCFRFSQKISFSFSGIFTSQYRGKFENSWNKTWFWWVQRKIILRQTWSGKKSGHKSYKKSQVKLFSPSFLKYHWPTLHYVVVVVVVACMLRYATRAIGYATCMLCTVLLHYTFSHYLRWIPLFPTFEFASVRASSPNAPGAIAIKSSFRGESLPTFSTLLCWPVQEAARSRTGVWWRKGR